ncbi:MAG: MBL fold metallo-hydrolase [Balneolaceae bacterium]|nr:MBL fold metallo-hydrolase [Balneolaceae bacterium]MDR9408524.1 MBL fold metallo-hydrolase [Balneolaceae bacterium]
MSNQPRVSALYEGTFSVGKDKLFHRIEKSDSPNKGALKLSINPFLIQDGKHNILFDAGIGDLFGKETSIHTMFENLEKHSLSEHDITEIFISHLHFDHIAGLANREHGFWEITFPEASVWVSEGGWNRLRENIDQNSEEEIEMFHFLDSKADLKFLSEKENPIPNIRVEQIGGHTKFHYALFYENSDHKYLMAGDVLGSKGAVNRVYKAKYDEFPDQSMEKREELQKLAFEEGYTIMAYHETNSPLFNLVSYDESKGYKIENVSG